MQMRSVHMEINCLLTNSLTYSREDNVIGSLPTETRVKCVIPLTYRIGGVSFTHIEYSPCWGAKTFILDSAVSKWNESPFTGGYS